MCVPPGSMRDTLVDVDVLVDLLERARARGANFGHTRVHGRWGVGSPSAAGMAVHVLVEGEAVVVTGNGAVHPLAAGDVAVLRGGVEHRLAADAEVPAEPLETFLARHRSDGRRCVGDGPGPASTFLCGAYQFSGDLLTSLFAQLPEVLVVRAEPGGSLRAAVDLLAAEIVTDAPGQQTLLDRLLDIVVIGALRVHLARAGDAAPGWYRASADPGVARALSAVHAEPGRAWTVASLARLGGTARSTFARRFAGVVGVPPLEYVTGWRMALARERLRDTTDPLAAVAREVGYGSEFAFAAAFKREHGTSPGRWRAGDRVAV